MAAGQDFTKGSISSSLIRFAFPVFCAMLLQSLYGAVDLFILGRFGSSMGVSAVATGSQIMWASTVLITGLSSGVTVMAANRIGQGKPEESGEIIGHAIAFFILLAAIMTLALELAIPSLMKVLNVPLEAEGETLAYLRVCAGGFSAICAYNLIGSIFRGVGDSVMPLITVAVSSALNVFGDLLFVKGLGMGAGGAATATVVSQVISVVLSLLIMKYRRLPFRFGLGNIRLNWKTNLSITKIGLPIGLQDVLISVSFMFLLSIINSRGVTASAGMGVGEKVCGFMMLVPSAFSQALSAFVAQNNGAGKLDRARKGLFVAFGMSFSVSVFIFWAAFFHGDIFCSFFTADQAVAAAGWSWLKAYAIDAMLTSFHFCFGGYFSGREKTLYVMAQGILSSFLVRIPVAYLMSLVPGSTLFQIGYGIPVSSLCQVIAGFIYLYIITRKDKETMSLR